MVRIFKIKELEERKRALAEECDLYRQTLRLDVQNLRLQAAWTKRRFTSFTTSPLWALIPSLLSSFAKGKHRRLPRWRIVSTALAAWQIYRKFTGLMGFFSRFRRASSTEEERAPAATI